MRIIKAFKNSMQGFHSCFKTEAAFREEIFLFLILFPASFFLAKNKIELLFMVLSIFLVLITELLNTGIEHAIDRIGLEHNELSGKAKDVASAAVFFSLSFLVFVWTIFLFF